jgi:hypothetical protein
MTSWAGRAVLSVPTDHEKQWDDVDFLIRYDTIVFGS